MSMISNHMDEYSSEDYLSSGDNLIVDPNDDVLQDGGDGKEGNLTKGPWGTEEDKRLKSYVTKNGPGNWAVVARELNRTPKSCRNRWCNQLNPDIIHAPFSAEEDKLIASMADDRGWGKWSRVAKKLKGRTDNQVDNRWHSKLKKQYGELRVKSPSRNLTSPAPAFNRFTSLSLCPPGHETDDVLYPGLFFNPSSLYPLPSQQDAPVGDFTLLMQESMTTELEQPNCASGLDGQSRFEH
ncbi:hypothetical protein QQ045_000527 [Rhodiola kirilowii]